MAPVSSTTRRTRLVLLALVAVVVTLAAVAVRSLPALAQPGMLESELAEGPVATVRQSEENIIGSLGMEKTSKAQTDGALLANADLVADGEKPAPVPASEEQESAADATEYSDAGEEEEGVVPGGGSTNFNKAASAEADLNSYFDNLPVHDVTPDHLPKGTREVVTHDGERRLSRGRAVSASAKSRFHHEPDSASEWQDKMNNLDEAIHLFRTKGDAALETAVKEGLTKQPYVPGELRSAQTQQDENMQEAGAIPSGLMRRMATSTGNKIGGVDGLRATQYKKLLDNIKGSLSKERQIMDKLRKDVAARKAQEAAAASGSKPAAAIEKYGDKKLDLNPPESSYYDEFSNFNPPKVGEPTKTPYHGAEGEEPQEGADDAQVPTAANTAQRAPAQLGFIGGAGVEGGQGNSDSIYGSHDDHSTYGVAGSGWQGPGNGEAPGDLWNPAKGDGPQKKAPSQLGFIGGAGVEGGQGNSDSIYGSHDDHDTYGVLGSGWQGPGNGEAPGDLWNPAKGHVHKGVDSGMKHAKARASNSENSLKDLSDGLAGSVKAISKNMFDERHELEEAQNTLKQTESVISKTLHAGQETQQKEHAAWAAARDGKDVERQGTAEGKGGKAGKLAKKGGKTTSLTRIDKIDEPSADLNPSWSPGWGYDEYSNFNPPKSGEPVMAKAGELNSKVGFHTWKGATASESPPIRGGRYGTSNEMDATKMSSVFKGTKTAMLKGKKSVKQQQLTRIDKIDEPSADLNPSWSPGWGYDEYSNFNPPKSGEPAMAKAGELNSKVGFHTWKGATASESPPIRGGRYGTSNEMDATPMSAIFKTPKQAALAMKNDEIAMDIDQKQLRLAEGTLAAMAMHTLKHHDMELARAHSPEGPEDPAKVEIWDKKDIARTSQERKLVDDLSDAVHSEQLQLNAAEEAMVRMEMVSTASLAKQIADRRSGASSKARQAHEDSKVGGKEGRAAVATSEAAKLSAPPSPMKLDWVKKVAGTALEGLSDTRAVLPSKRDMKHAVHPRRGASKQQQLALAAGGKGAPQVVKRVAAKASGFGLCALFGLACS